MARHATLPCAPPHPAGRQWACLEYRRQEQGLGEGAGASGGPAAGPILHPAQDYDPEREPPRRRLALLNLASGEWRPSKHTVQRIFQQFGPLEAGRSRCTTARLAVWGCGLWLDGWMDAVLPCIRLQAGGQGAPAAPMHRGACHTSPLFFRPPRPPGSQQACCPSRGPPCPAVDMPPRLHCAFIHFESVAVAQRALRALGGRDMPELTGALCPAVKRFLRSQRAASHLASACAAAAAGVALHSAVSLPVGGWAVWCGFNAQQGSAPGPPRRHPVGQAGVPHTQRAQQAAGWAARGGCGQRAGGAAGRQRRWRQRCR